MQLDFMITLILYLCNVVNRRAVEIRSFLKTLKIRRAKLIGHILCHNSQLSRIIEGPIRVITAKGDRHWTTLVK